MPKYGFQESRSPGSSSPVLSSSNSDPDQRIMTSHTMWYPKVTERFEKRDRSCFVTSKIPTDLAVQINDITFYFHKFPLMTKSGYMSRLVLHDQSDDVHYDYDIKMDNFPGGSDTFELILKFCYGLPIDLTPANVAPLRCAAEFLEMTEDVADGNLVSKTESFITFAVLTSWRDTISLLRSCASLSPWAENLQIVRRCCDSIARKATEEATTADDEKWWFDEVCVLGINHFVRIITLVGAKGAKPETVGACLERYATKWLPGFDHAPKEQTADGRSEIQLSILSGADESGGRGGQINKEERTTIENLISALPQQREAVPCRFLLWMLKMATMYSVSPALLSELEKRVGMVLEDATVNDLLIPNYPTGEGSPTTTTNTMHNVEMVYRIVENFLIHKQQQKRARNNVGRLLDGYLAEIARDANLTPSSFQAIAEALPTNSRSCDDGLYRAIDIYLKAHPTLSEHERRRLCRVMDCDKLSLDACLHAAQNDRLPLRIVVQVLFTEQLKMRAAMDQRQPQDLTPEECTTSEPGSSCCSTKQEVVALKAEVESMKAKVAELHQECAELHQELGQAKHGKKSMSVWKKFRDSALFYRKTDGEEVSEGTQLRPRIRRVSLA